MIKMILAVDRGNAIGWSDGRLPWKIPGDMKRFKELTTGGNVVMGYNTYKSLNRPNGLPNRKNILLTRRSWSEIRSSVGGEIEVYSNIDGIAASQRGLGIDPSTFPDYWVIGGAVVYNEFIQKKLVDEIYLTIVHDDSGADVKLPFNLSAWKLFVLQQEKIGVKWILTEHEDHASEADAPSYTFITLKKLNEHFSYEGL